MPCIWVKKYVSSDKKLVRWFFYKGSYWPWYIGIVTAVVEIAGLFWVAGEMIQFDYSNIFSDGLVQPPTS